MPVCHTSKTESTEKMCLKLYHIYSRCEQNLQKSSHFSCSVAFTFSCCIYFYNSATWKQHGRRDFLENMKAGSFDASKIIRLCGGFFYSISLFIQNFHHDIAKRFCGFRVIAAWWECDSELNRGSILAERQEFGVPKIMP